jgi:hypothetical protein
MLVVVMKGVFQQLIACNKLVVVMKGVFWRGGSQEVARPITTTWIKMEDGCILCIAVEFFSRKRIIKTKKKEGLITFLSSKYRWHNHVRTYEPIHVNIQIFQMLKGRIDWWGIVYDSSCLWFEWHRK